MTLELGWLPRQTNWSDQVDAARKESDTAVAWAALTRCANANLDWQQTLKLDRATQKLFSTAGLPIAMQPFRLALLGSSTLKHLVPSIRLAGLRREWWIEVFEGDYGQYRQQLLDGASALYAFRPDVVCLALDAHHVEAETVEGIESLLATLRQCWAAAQANLGCTVIQQTVLPLFPEIMGQNEDRLPTSPQSRLREFNASLRAVAATTGIVLLSLDTEAAKEGVRQWHDDPLWLRSKQEVHPNASPLYGELLVRLIAAQRGRSAKCLVLDLDNTLWGGVIGDDGLQGIVLGQGSAEGEAYVVFQQYAKQLNQRGILLAVCSKNDEFNATEVFAKHPDMVLRREDIACFVANWQDKPSNLREIASRLNIGLDTLVFADDNPFERDLVRRELPEVHVPELPEDPALYAKMFADAGYFESLALTAEDRKRGTLYQANLAREQMMQGATNVEDYLQSLRMKLILAPFDTVGLPRIVQLINKTNQFNLTTRRYSAAEVEAMLTDSSFLTLQARLVDRFADNGMIAIMIGKMESLGEVKIDTWLMSCRVLGRHVEEACLAALARQAERLGATRLVGEYRPSAKNGMVTNLYDRLGFQSLGRDTEGNTTWALHLPSQLMPPEYIDLEEVHHARN